MPEYSARDLLRLEKESSGLYFTGHLLDDYEKHLNTVHPANIAEIKGSFSGEDEELGEEVISTPQYADKQRVTVAGIVTRRQNKATRSGEQMAFVTLEDRSGEMEIIVFPKVAVQYSAYLTVNAAVIISGSVTVRDDEDPKIILNSAEGLVENSAWTLRKAPAPEGNTAEKQNPSPAREASKKTPSRLFLKVPGMESEQYRRAESVLGIFPGNIPVVFYDASTGKYLRAEHLGAPDSAFVLRELREILGEDAVQLR